MSSSLHTCSIWCLLMLFSCWAKHQLVTLLWLTVSPPPPPPVLPAALGIVLTSGCATSRHCQQQELPGVRIHCCDSDLCNSAPSRNPGTLHYICAVATLLLLRMWLWFGVNLERNRTSLCCTCTIWEKRFVLKTHLFSKLLMLRDEWEFYSVVMLLASTLK